VVFFFYIPQSLANISVLKGQVPINLRITINGKRTELATNRMIHPDLWDTPSNSPKGKGDEAQILKNYLSSQ